MGAAVRGQSGSRDWDSSCRGFLSVGRWLAMEVQSWHLPCEMAAAVLAGWELLAGEALLVPVAEVWLGDRIALWGRASP